LMALFLTDIALRTNQLFYCTPLAALMAQDHE